MLPLIAYESELVALRRLVDQRGSSTLENRTGGASRSRIGTMIELPQGLPGRRRDRRARRVLQLRHERPHPDGPWVVATTPSVAFCPTTYPEGLVARSPFETIDAEGVGELVKTAAERGRATKPGLKLGICGEHGGDPASIEFFDAAGLDYVSCSPTACRSRGSRRPGPRLDDTRSLAAGNVLGLPTTSITTRSGTDVTGAVRALERLTMGLSEVGLDTLRPERFRELIGDSFDALDPVIARARCAAAGPGRLALQLDRAWRGRGRNAPLLPRIRARRRGRRSLDGGGWGSGASSSPSAYTTTFTAIPVMEERWGRRRGASTGRPWPTPPESSPNWCVAATSCSCTIRRPPEW